MVTDSDTWSISDIRSSLIHSDTDQNNNESTIAAILHIILVGKVHQEKLFRPIDYKIL